MNYKVILLILCITFTTLISVALKETQDSTVTTQFSIENWQMEQGLPVNSILSIAQTADGWLFFGTEEGLVKFNGKTFVLFDKTNIPGLKVNFISVLIGGRDSSLWIGTDGDGLFRLKNNIFTKYKGSAALLNAHILAMCEDPSGGLWIGTSGDGLIFLNDDKVKRFDTLSGLSSNYVRSIIVDVTGKVWIGTQRGLNFLDHEKFTSYYRCDGLSDNFIESLALDREQNLWIGTKGGGLDVLKKGRFSVFTVKDGLTHDAVVALWYDSKGVLWTGTNGGGITQVIGGKFYPLSKKEGLKGDLIVSLFGDREGNIWAGSSGTGIYRISRKSIQALSGRNGLPGEVILPLFEDHDKALWIGIAGKGLTRYVNGHVKTFTYREGLPDHLVLTLTEDNDHALWIGTAGGGLTRFKDGRFTTYTDKDGLSNNVVIAVYCDQAGNLWAGTTGGGINRLEGGKFKTFTTRQGLSDDNVTCIHEDTKGALWVGTNRGLNRITDDKITLFDAKDGLSSDFILSLFEDQQANIWVGTSANGFYLIREGKITRFTTSDGLPDEVVLCILEDDFGYLWLSCNKGIYKISKQELFDFADSKIKSLAPLLYDKSDGMETTECNGGISPAGFKLHDGRLMFPTMKGVAVIDPKALKASSSSFYPIFLEELVVDGQPLQFNSSLVLPATAHRIEFRYAALNYSHPEKVKYRCMVVGFDKNWVDCESHRSVFYTNIPYGDYVFKVMASNESGQWSEASSLSVKFNITSPFYRTYGFYLLVSLILFLLLFNGAYNFIGRYQRNRLELLVAKRTDELEQKMVIQEQMRKELEVTNHDLVVAKEKAEESDRLKGAFLANMSHEIRTPMNGILGFSELLDDEELSASDRKKFLGIISRNGKQLLTVINDILDISKLDFNQLILSKTSFNINMLLDSLFLFIDKERLRLGKSGIRIELEKGVEDDKCIIFTDEMRFTQILNNLVGNALKFTNTGIIKIGYRPEGENLLFFVQDTGKGIAIDKQEIIFDRFRQEEERDTRTFGGTGLGLSISKGLVELLGGTIWVVSEPGQGSVFYFTVPGFLLKQPLVPKSVVNPVKIVPDFKGRKILIVEDVYSNFELIEFIIHKSHPEIIYAEDGMKAIACCHSDPEIELILMDIRMPVMDGYEATREIRKFRPDIPIIALTAHAFTEEKIRSIEAGCNDFISKPIEKDKLMAVLIRFLNDKLY